MEVILSPDALDDLKHWKQTGNDKMVERIKQLIIDIQDNPFHGIEKPEPLKHKFSGMWSRRINREHRTIFKVSAGTITIHALKEHY
jgi:toxin YoeB